MNNIINIFIGVLIILLCLCCRDKKDVSGTALISKKNQQTITDSVSTDYLMGHFNPVEHSEFVEINTAYSSRSGLYLRKETYSAFRQMYDAAQKDSISLIIRSATRNFEYQKGIWERKWNGQTKLSDGTDASTIDSEKERALRILLYSSMPGSSRHHWGTDIDLNSFDNTYFESGQGLDEYEWLITHGPKFGFCQPYTDKSDGRTGYEEEKWHWTYTPLSSQFTALAAQHLDNEMITGFLGSQTSVDIDVVNNYVLGIDQACN